ncbi:biotrophy-associated secreted protein 2 [Colletotrichum incanum]|uniref:Biotrophy-associated secreted protein 2 n=1 Tax=Colletotrichum incanum TaxID=1573173 RepID=A0A161WHP6_COLIC|nr:biotrophy-associated secreted protein 2 [Colletotrichum incanum]OHW98768.1 biotrophy-associated secreted protein 2 [Colletotrichum incanum]
MVRLAFAAALFAATTLAVPNPLTPDPSGDKNVGNGQGVQFIGGACLNSKDCASACCATLSGAGICSGVGAQFQAGKQGCGFGDGGAAAAPAPSQEAGQATPSMESAAGNGSIADTGSSSTPGSSNVGAGNGLQFITGQCLSDADCTSGCCAGPKGACAARAVAEENGKSGCGFTGAGGAAGSPNGSAAEDAAPSAPPQAAPPASGGSSGANQGAAGSQNVGTGNGQQFITGQCLSDADCASGCCAGPKGACSAVAVANENGKTGCGFTAA